MQVAGQADVPGALHDPIPRARSRQRRTGAVGSDQALEQQRRGPDRRRRLPARRSGAARPFAMRADPADRGAQASRRPGPQQPAGREGEEAQVGVRGPAGGAEDDPIRRVGRGEVAGQRKGLDRGPSAGSPRPFPRLGAHSGGPAPRRRSSFPSAELYGPRPSRGRRGPRPHVNCAVTPDGSRTFASAGSGCGHDPAVRRLSASLQKVPPAGVSGLDRLVGLLPGLDRRGGACCSSPGPRRTPARSPTSS